MLAAILVIAFSGSDSGAAGNPTLPSTDSRAQSLTASRVSAPEKCPGVLKSLRYYRGEVSTWLGKRGERAKFRVLNVGACPRYLLHVTVAKARGARLAYERWFAYHYHWWEWMPAKWQRIGACETGYGKRPGRFDWNSGTYQGFAGFYYGTWDQYKPAGAPSEAYLATPRQQYQCALNVYAAHGYGAWGCGGA